MVYKIETKGLQRIVIARIDSKYSEIISRNKDQKFFLPFVEEKRMKKIELTYGIAEDNLCTVRFSIHKAAGLIIIEIMIDIAIEILEDIYKSTNQGDK
jgi:isocitrate lyase